MKKVFFFIFVIVFSAIRCIPADSEQITFSADSMSGTAGSKSDTTRLTGNAYVKTADMEISAASIYLNGDNFRFVTAEGSVTATNTTTNMKFTCGKLEYDREMKIATLENSVHLTDSENGVTAEAQIIEYNQEAETAILQINVTLKQKDNVCTGAYAMYHKKNQILELSGNPEIVQGKDQFRAQEISLDLTSQEIQLNGRVSGTVTNTKEDRSATEPEQAPEQQQKPEETAKEPEADNGGNAHAPR